ncbi:glycosyl hydrolase family 28-related protein [Planomicrobium sp. CPCC 101079]|uniref:glycosyl hydrolase family 28-related protein n=1 Tax=Planomicrobium sp. CPCC 101079 TaxID=2599618 RepID=UPI0011B6C3C0|nr:glycosyl hydrolase family 28-related protein [Planomicrobium sp. CPCC 101079]TWT03625.1 right-handed parallel beta-helix repeat-containing protein [Planomicrobium sp. CPCC 101079]
MISKSQVFITLILISMTALFYFNKSPANNGADSAASVADFGAKGDGKNDDTNSIQDAIDEVSEAGGGVVTIAEGTYLVDAIESIKVKDNITLDFESGAVIKAMPNGADNYAIISIHDVENVKITGKPVIQGERTEHTGETGEWGFGISIKGATGVSIENANITDCWGDGIYIGPSEKQNYSKDVVIKDPLLENNRRQGISVISAKNLKITDPVINNTSGTDPQSGIDIEPNSNTEHLENIEIVNLATKNNEGFGFQIYLENFENSENQVSITLDTSKNITDGISIAKTDNIEGEIKIGEEQFLPDL